MKFTKKQNQVEAALFVKKNYSAALRLVCGRASKGVVREMEDHNGGGFYITIAGTQVDVPYGWWIIKEGRGREARFSLCDPRYFSSSFHKLGFPD